MPSSTPPGGDPLRYTHKQDNLIGSWNHDLLVNATKKLLGDTGDSTTAQGGGRAGELQAGSSLDYGGKASTDQNHNIEPRKQGDGASVEGRMNTNGFGRGAMTGSRTTTGDTQSWIGDVPVTQAGRGHHVPPALHTSVAGHAHDHHLMHPGSSGVSSGLYRPQPTEASQRLYPGQYQPLYTSGSGLAQPYSPSLYGTPPSGQSSQLASLTAYGAFYQQYAAAHGYSHAASLLSGHFPHVESYSAVLATMGSHVQHAQSQLPRTPFIPHQYGALTPTNSPGPNVPRPLTPGQHPLPVGGMVDPHQRDTKSPKLEPRESFRPRVGSPPKDSRQHPHGHYPAHSGIIHRTSMLRDPSKFDFGREGKSSSVSIPPDPRRGYLGRPEVLGESSYSHEHRHSHLRQEESPAKRHKGGQTPPPSKSQPGTSSSQPAHGQHLPQIPPGGLPGPHPHYPPHFTKGSIIQLANGDLKRVEDLRTEDFVQSAEVSSDLKIDSSTVVKIEENAEKGTTLLGFSVGEHRIQVTVEAMMEHPFFVFGQGWSSCSPDRTMHRYGLPCQKLSVGDVCISLTHKDASQHLASQAQVSQAGPSGPSSSQAKDRVVAPPATGSSRDSSGKGHERVSLEGGGEESTPSGRQPPSPTVSQPSGPASPPAAQSSQVPRPGVIFPRKRRWSAPDHLRTEADPGDDPSSVARTSGPQPGPGHDRLPPR